MSQAPVMSSGPGRVPPGSTKLLIVAVAMAVVAVVLVNMYVWAAKRSVKEGEFLVFRLNVAKSPGQRLDARDVERVAVPDSFRDAFVDAVQPSASTGQPTRIGDLFTRPAEPRDVLRERHFDIVSEDGSRLLIQSGMRGVALPVESKTLPEPLKPEMFVDLEAPFRGPGGAVEVLPVMEMVRVVSVGDTSIVQEQRGRGGGSNSSKLTIEVTPEQASQLEAIGTIVSGNFRVHLRRTDDRSRPKIPEGGINPEVLARLGQAGLSF